MKDCNTEITKFHNEAVKLSADTRQELRSRALANEERLEKGLAKNGEPAPQWFVLQGSYAMHTTVQHPDNDYDIDDGVVFSKQDLKGAQGADKTSLDARKMVCDALKADPLKNFSQDPEVRNNCVRVYYKTGYHVDIPVYRVEDPNSDSKIYELASAVWKSSSPEGVTDWFKKQVKDKRNSSENDKASQFRRMVRLFKKFAGRTSWNMPSGFILTVLASEKFVYRTRDDEAFYDLLTGVKNRLSNWNGLVVYHPVLTSETITKTTEDANMKELRTRIDTAISDLSVLFDEDCTKKAALKAWKKVFGDSFFDKFIEEATAAKTFSILSSEPKSAIEKDGGGRFG